MSPFRIAVLASGSGTNLQAILDKLHGGGEIEVVGVASDKPDAGALERARAAGVETAVFTGEDHGGREERDAAIAAWLAERDVDLVVLAGYMQLLSPAFVERFRHRIINVHPALLPSFPGAHGVREALAYGVKVTGCTVHWADAGVDTGPIIAQEAVAIEDGDTEETLHERIKVVERRLLVSTLASLAAEHSAA